MVYSTGFANKPVFFMRARRKLRSGKRESRLRRRNVPYCNVKHSEINFIVLKYK